MKRSEVNDLVREAAAFFAEGGWALPPEPRWDVTDFGLGDWRRFGLVLVNLAEEPEYCEKLMFALKGMTTPAHTHVKKKEDIVCRKGLLGSRVWCGPPGSQGELSLAVNGVRGSFPSGAEIQLEAGSRVTLTPGIYHEFAPLSDRCIIGEVSTANDDVHDNLFADTNVGRFSRLEEDEPAIVKLVSD